MRYSFKALICGDNMTTEIEGRAVGQTPTSAENKIRSGLAKQFNTDGQSIIIEVTEI